MSDNPFGDDDTEKSQQATPQQTQKQDFQVAQETSFSPESQSISRLTAATRFYIRRPREPDQVLVSHDVTKKFEVLDQNGAPMYYLVQEDSCCSRTFCCMGKWFSVDVYDLDEVHVGHLEKSIGCLTCWCGCCPQNMDIHFPPTKKIGQISQTWNFFGSPEFRTVNDKRDLVFLFSGSGLCGVKKISISSGTKERVGKMKNQWDGLPAAQFGSQICFGVDFEKSKTKLDLEHLYLLLGSSFLMAYNYFGANKKVKHEELIGLKSS
ncbi:Oidioi.mRNA.OKI2018_I69.PAR.g11941.t1.cds [Oikopleura dioica]|uniref:Phospholipid scramblase n=1 Tax=Oikopleura dioica TaxID=34765 RepID=A0ABN7S2D4_OIKDI|nr:Oidioi.mRNA.OKI2018_I69.PAR.g11941.t1.cds [Oikopleura dioica]